MTVFTPSLPRVCSLVDRTEQRYLLQFKMAPLQQAYLEVIDQYNALTPRSSSSVSSFLSATTTSTPSPIPTPRSSYRTPSTLTAYHHSTSSSTTNDDNSNSNSNNKLDDNPIVYSNRFGEGLFSTRRGSRARTDSDVRMETTNTLDQTIAGSQVNESGQLSGHTIVLSDEENVLVHAYRVLRLYSISLSLFVGEWMIENNYIGDE